MWVKFQNNPAGRNVGDCAVRAISVALSVDWETAFAMLVAYGYMLSDMPSSNAVSGAVLKSHGFKRKNIPDTCPACYTIADFCEDNPRGIFVIGTAGHIVTAIDGDVYDSWNSLTETALYAWYKPDTV